MPWWQRATWWVRTIIVSSRSRTPSCAPCSRNTTGWPNRRGAPRAKALARSVRTRAAPRDRSDGGYAPIDRLARQHLIERVGQELHRFVDVRLRDHERRHEAHRALAASKQDEAVVISARDQRIAELLCGSLARAVGDQLHADHETLAAHFANHRRFAGQRLELLHEIGADFRGVH